MENLHAIFDSVGLSPSCLAVYRAGQRKTQTSSELVSSTKLPRPTVLAALQDLRVIGLCATSERDGRSYTYTMNDLGALKPHLGAQVRSIEQMMDRLDTEPEGAPRTETSHWLGQEALESSLEFALRCRVRKWNIIAPKDNALKYLSKNYISYFKRVRKEREIISQTLWEHKSDGQPIDLMNVLMRKPRYVDKQFSDTIPALLLAFDDRLLAVSGTTNPSVMVITSSEITDTFNIVFEIAWRNSKN